MVVDTEADLLVGTEGTVVVVVMVGEDRGETTCNLGATIRAGVEVVADTMEQVGAMRVKQGEGAVRRGEVVDREDTAEGMADAEEVVVGVMPKRPGSVTGADDSECGWCH